MPTALWDERFEYASVRTGESVSWKQHAWKRKFHAILPSGLPICGCAGRLDEFPVSRTEDPSADARCCGNCQGLVRRAVRKRVDEWGNQKALAKPEQPR